MASLDLKPAGPPAPSYGLAGPTLAPFPYHRLEPSAPAAAPKTASAPAHAEAVAPPDPPAPTRVAPVIVPVADKHDGLPEKVGGVVGGVIGGVAGAAVAGPVGKFAGGFVGKKIAHNLMDGDDTPRVEVTQVAPSAYDHAASAVAEPATAPPLD